MAAVRSIEHHQSVRGDQVTERREKRGADRVDDGERRRGYWAPLGDESASDDEEYPLGSDALCMQLATPSLVRQTQQGTGHTGGERARNVDVAAPAASVRAQYEQFVDQLVARLSEPLNIDSVSADAGSVFVVSADHAAGAVRYHALVADRLRWLQAQEDERRRQRQARLQQLREALRRQREQAEEAAEAARRRSRLAEAASRQLPAETTRSIAPSPPPSPVRPVRPPSPPAKTAPSPTLASRPEALEWRRALEFCDRLQEAAREPDRPQRRVGHRQVTAAGAVAATGRWRRPLPSQRGLGALAHRGAHRARGRGTGGAVHRIGVRAGQRAGGAVRGMSQLARGGHGAVSRGLSVYGAGNAAPGGQSVRRDGVVDVDGARRERQTAAHHRAVVGERAGGGRLRDAFALRSATAEGVAADRDAGGTAAAAYRTARPDGPVGVVDADARATTHRRNATAERKDAAAHRLEELVRWEEEQAVWSGCMCMQSAAAPQATFEPCRPIQTRPPHRHAIAGVAQVAQATAAKDRRPHHRAGGTAVRDVRLAHRGHHRRSHRQGGHCVRQGAHRHPVSDGGAVAIPIVLRGGVAGAGARLPDAVGRLVERRGRVVRRPALRHLFPIVFRLAGGVLPAAGPESHAIRSMRSQRQHRALLLVGGVEHLSHHDCGQLRLGHPAVHLSGHCASTPAAPGTARATAPSVLCPRDRFAAVDAGGRR
eukprot:ctg_1990.g420